MDNEELKLWKKAGQLTAEARDYGKTLVKEGANLLEIANKIEDFIIKKGGKIAFPVQISKNNIAAHYTPFPDDPTVIENGDVIKLDLGVHCNGYIGDSALTIEIGTKDHQELIKANINSLNEAIKLCKPGVKVCELGKAVFDVVNPTGLKAIRNLCGHKIDRYLLHSHISIPNYDNNDKTELEEGTVIAIEPHISNGVGLIKEGKPSGNFRVYNLRNVRDPMTKSALEFINKEHTTLPFAIRHLTKKFPLAKVNYALNNLKKQDIIYEYAQLLEKDPKAYVSQQEHTIMIADKPIVLTKGE